MQTIYPPSASSSALYGLGISDVPYGTQNYQPTHSTLANVPILVGDVTSPEAFRNCIHLVHQQVNRVQTLARKALADIEHAYHPRRSPTTTYLYELKQSLEVLVEILRLSGVGAMPLLTATDPVPTEEKLMADLSKSIEQEYSKYKRMQESSAVAFNLLNSVEQTLKR